MKTSPKTFYLGVEGGGTKSNAILFDDQDRIIAQRDGKALNYHGEGEKIAKKNLVDLLTPLLKKTKNEKLYAVLGFAGLNTEKDEIVYRNITRSALPAEATFEVLNDAPVALEAKCPGEEHRMLIIAGTGSSVYGESAGKQAKSVGWDYVLGDEGSGYSVGTKVLKTATQSWDGRIKKTLLEELVLKHTKSKTMEDFTAEFYKTLNGQKQSAKTYIASFGPLVNEGIIKNDWAALKIRQETVQELVVGVVAVGERLHLKEKRFCIGLIGSLWKMPGLKEKFEQEIKKRFPLAEFSNKEEGGEWGAILLAKKLGE